MPRKSSASWVINNLAIVVTIVDALISSFATFYFADLQIKRNLVVRAETIAGLLDIAHIESLKGNEEDLLDTKYQDLKKRLIELREVNNDSRFIYIMRNGSEGLLFLVDSEKPSSPDYSPPGQMYEEASEQLLYDAERGVSGLEIAGDRWGLWITGYAPMHNHETDQIVGLIGIDLDYYQSYLLPLLAYTSIPILAFSILSLVLVYTKRLEQLKRDALEEQEKLMHIASHEVGTPMAEIRWMIDNLLAKKEIQGNKELLSISRQLFTSSHSVLRRIMNLPTASDLASKKELHMQKIDSIPILKNAIQNQQKAAKVMEVAMKISLPEKAVLVFADSHYLEIVFSNLISHSLFYAKNEKRIEIKVEERGHLYVFSFTSIGDMLSKEELDTLFVPYYLGNPMSFHTEGTGFGLYVSKRIAEKHKGSLRAEVHDGGTTLLVTLPKV
jgi:signal transduction histidine kinase